MYLIESVSTSGRSLTTVRCTASRQTGITWLPAALPTTVLFDSGTNVSPSVSRWEQFPFRSVMYMWTRLWHHVVFVSVLPAVRSPCDQPCVLPEVQQFSPVRSPGQHARDSGLQLEPHLNHARRETVPACELFIQLDFWKLCFQQLLYLSPRIKLKQVGQSSFFYFLLVSTLILVFHIFVNGKSWVRL